jgi:hypothetical protein
VDQQQSKRTYAKPVSLLLVEGDTDEIFYNRIKAGSLCECRIVIKNLEGLFNVNKKIFVKISDYIERKNELVRVYCCLDRESRNGDVPVDLQEIIKRLTEKGMTQVLSLDAIIATQQIESWFFYDIEQIYKFLSVPHSHRKMNAYKPPEKYGYRDLQVLFESHHKTYSKGKRSKNFIDNLNMDKIIADCKDLSRGIELIRAQADDLRNHIFSNV